ncbi:ERF family protein [Methylobacterium iners]|uniref:ERF family protein n=1 Tax=Methylobacterium iners TaxID=418707 RepID=A0ABQ4RT82_9HYPH|nr:ERF family protein [Methylobacterium iners]GJD92883.1 hypothetical protein OCOJLMKI_0066 [Methylobacterium iners]
MSTPALKQDVATRDEPTPPAPTGEPATILSLIERAARDPSVDLDRMERLFEMREKMLAREAETAFNAAMSAAQAELPQVLRRAENSHTNSRYAKLEHIAQAITPIYTKHGFSLSFDTVDCPLAGHYRLVCKVAHAGGFSRSHQADLPADGAGAQGRANKTGIQAFGSTMSYGRRYLTLLVFNVALTNEDNDGNRVAPADEGGDEFVSDEQAETIRRLIGETRSDVNRFLGFIGAESISDIPASKFQFAVNQLKRKAGR